MAVIGAFIMPHPPVIIPAVGKGEESAIQKTADACGRVAQEIAALHPDTIVITSPHAELYADYLHIAPGSRAEGSFDRFGAPEEAFAFDCDTEFAAALTEEAKKRKLPAGTFGDRNRPVDHGALVPLFFVNRSFRDYRLVRCSISGLGPLEHYRFGECIAAAAETLGRRTVLIASGDLSHKLTPEGPYGFAKEGPEFDRRITDAMKEADFLRFLSFDEDFCEAAAQCGLSSFIILAGALDGFAVKTEFLSYEGPFGVGYAVCSYLPQERDEARRFGQQFEGIRREALSDRRRDEDEYVRLARLSLETWVIEGRRATPPAGLPSELTEKRAGVFVSLKKNGRLRGCIGTILPVQGSVAAEIIRNAISAGSRDPRFDAVTEEELPELVYSVDVLGRSEPVNSPADLDPKRYGVIVRNEGHCGLLLPDLAGVDTVRRQVEIALEKAGITGEEPYALERFEVVRHL